MKIIDALLAKIAPYDCIMCGAEGALVCGSCAPSLGDRAPSRCFRCQKQTDRFKVCESCRSSVSVRSVAAHFCYKGFAKQLVKEFKFNGKRGAAAEIARLMSIALPEGAVLVHIPTATSRVRARGYDHARLLAAALSAESGLPHRTFLARISQNRQVGTGRSERLRHISGAFRVVGNVRNAHIILVDDVVTTGATLSEAARILRAEGARCVDAVTFAYTPQ